MQLGFMNKSPYSKKIAVGTRLHRGKIIPVFLPFAGCPFTCIYCVQDLQTGVSWRNIEDALENLESDIETFIQKKSGEKVEIAFYGGTFTALDYVDFMACVNAFVKIKEKLESHGFEVFGRCSTRPDCLQSETQIEYLSILKKNGIDLIELGIQSFDEDTLFSLSRGYDVKVAKSACAFVKDKGFLLGIQLMPSSPCFRHNLNTEKSQKPETFLSDVEEALSFLPACLRFYPCLVPRNTKLAKFWELGLFEPWDLQTCVDTLGIALAMAWEKKVSVIRLSVAPEKSFDTQILSGVRHQSFGSLVQAKALLIAFDNALKDICHESEEAFSKEKRVFYIPSFFQGFLFGHKNSLKETWENRLSLKNILFMSKNPEEIDNYAYIVLDDTSYKTKNTIFF